MKTQISGALLFAALMMAALTVPSVLVGVAAAAGLAGESVDTPPREANGKLPSKTARDIELDQLFVQLSVAKTPDDAKEVEKAIWARWNKSGSISVDLLMSRGVHALSEGDVDVALTFFDEVVDLAPGYAEGWSKRATVHFLKDDYSAALSDIEATLALEPRHFGAIGGLALVLEDLGDKEGARDAYRRVLKVYPWLEGAVDAENRLTVEIDGRGI
ncbi:MAG: tetratricopeptide repeat protein [Parvibaculum sp.]